MSRRPLRAGAAIAAVAALAYAPSFGVPFQFDDHARLGGNWSLQHGGLLEALMWMGNARLVPALTLVANYRLGGFDPRGYHAVNFAVHLLTTAGVFALALALCGTPRLREAWPPARALWVATAAALVFAVHPLQTQAVTYIIQRFASMAALFYVWAVVCYLRARGARGDVGPSRLGPLGPTSPRFVAAMFGCAVLGALTKENVASLPAALLLVEAIGYGRPRQWRTLAGAALVVAAVLALPVLWRLSFWKPTRGLVTASPVDYLLTQMTVLPRYLALVVLPWGQNVDHDVPIATSLSLAVLAGAATLLALALIGVSQARRWPLVAFAIGWFFVTSSVESTVVPISDVMAEHRMYLPMAGLAIGAGSIYAAARARWRRAAPIAGLAIVGALAGLTFARNLVWRSPLTLWLDAAQKSPGKNRPHVNLGTAYVAEERFEEAAGEFCRAVAIDASDGVARENLEIVLEVLGEPANSYCADSPQRHKDTKRTLW